MEAVRHYRRFDRRIGIVCDRIFYDTVESAADFVYVRHGEEWRDAISGIDCLMVVSTWRGLDNDDWRGVAKDGSPQRKLLYRIIDSCRELGKPTVFYSKEDPPNYNVFIDIARRCDCVFTSAAEMVPRYIADCGHERVAVMPFCVDPGRQNPIAPATATIGGEFGGVVFSGSWMMKYPERCSALKILLDGAAASGRELRILDRNSYLKSVSIRYPERYQAYLRPAVPHDELVALHKSSEWSINVNSVADSATMFAGRCYELLAAGCPVVSNYSYGMSRLLPAVAIGYSAEDVSGTVRRSDPELIRARRIAGIREVMDGNTCYDRIGSVLKAAGFSDSQPDRTLAVVVDAVDPDFRRMFDSQTFKAKSLFAAGEFDEEAFGRFDYVARWERGCEYGPHYLEDMVNSFKFGEFDFAVESGDGYRLFSGSPVPGRTVVWRSSISFGDFASGVFPDGQKGISVPEIGPLVRPAEIVAADGKIAVVEISVGRDADGLCLRSIPSLRRSDNFGRLRIILRDIHGDDAVVAAAATRMRDAYPGIVQIGGVAEEGLVRFAMNASDEALCPGFDIMLSEAEKAGAGKVSGDVLVCGRNPVVVAAAVSATCPADGPEAKIEHIVLSRYEESDGVDGRIWKLPVFVEEKAKKAKESRRPAKKRERPLPPRYGEPLWKRALGCYQDNGLVYTIKRILFGRQY